MMLHYWGHNDESLIVQLSYKIQGWWKQLKFRWARTHTSYNSFYKWTKISSLEIIIFKLKNDGKKLSKIYFEIDRAPSEIPAKLLGQFGHFG